MSLDSIENGSLVKEMTLVGCGVFSEEIRYLIKKNNWPLSVRFFDSSLHVNFDKLQGALERGLEQTEGKQTIVFYGTCHPLMDRILQKHNTSRTQGQNCIEILLGKDRFTQELKKGAFFLVEDWARRFEYVTGIAFNNKPEITREIFQLEHKYLLCLRTRCSKDFKKDAEHVSALVGLPLHWMDVDLNHLEQTLEKSIDYRRND